MSPQQLIVPALAKYIALALIENGQSHMDKALIATFPLKNEQNNVIVVDPCFYDKEGARLYV